MSKFLGKITHEDGFFYRTAYFFGDGPSIKDLDPFWFSLRFLAMFVTARLAQVIFLVVSAFVAILFAKRINLKEDGKFFEPIRSWPTFRGKRIYPLWIALAIASALHPAVAGHVLLSTILLFIAAFIILFMLFGVISMIDWPPPNNTPWLD